jgi:TetR/AcrR family tetracycline transcriptional repressor
VALNREAVVRTGLRVLNEVGLEALTLRKIADELDVQPPALYWHFTSKQDLIDEMATTLLTDGIAAIPPDIEWRAFAVMYGEGLRQLLRRYRDGAKMFAGTYLTDTSVYRHQEAALRIFTSGGFALADAATALHTIYCYTIGFVIEEQAVHPRPGERAPQYDPARRAERMAHENVPLAAEAGTAFFEDFNARFTRGLEAIVAGVALWARGAPSADGPAA